MEVFLFVGEADIVETLERETSAGKGICMNTSWLVGFSSCSTRESKDDWLRVQRKAHVDVAMKKGRSSALCTLATTFSTSLPG